MSLADELRKLQEFYEIGALSEAEFNRAKAILIANPPDPNESAQLSVRGRNDPLGRPAKAWLLLRIAIVILGFGLLAIFFFAYALPQWSRIREERERIRQRIDQKP